MEKHNNYTVTHIHSMLSNGVTNIDSITNFRDYVAKAKECGMSAMAITEHGSIFEWIHKKEEIEKAGMKYIHGIEAYITESLDEKIRDNYHCCLYAKNYDGVKELNELSSKSFNRDDGHYYYVPRITFEELLNTSNNIIISTACLGGILHKGNDKIKEQFICFLMNNSSRCFLEIQHHCDTAGNQKEYNKYLYKLSKEIGVPLITGTDTHALNDDHLEGRSILQKSKNVFFEDEESWDLTFKTYDELVEAYKKQNSLPMEVVLDAINNTNRLADMVEAFEIDRSYKYPHLWENPMQLFKDKINAGIIERGVDKYPNYQEYLDRIDYEMKAYVHNQAIDFMLLMEDIISWCKTQNIRVGYGRGSVNGSIVAWLLGITEMDSIKHGLNFDRFMNVERVSLSDIDTDFPPSRIDEVKQYIFSKHGLYCCDIVTFNTVADKGAIRDVGRALKIPLSEVSNICNSVDNEELFELNKKKYAKLFKYVDLIKGTIVSVGSHPCGCVVSPHSVTDAFGTFTTVTSDYPVSQINMKEIDSLNYVKLDLLRLDTIELINETCDLAGIKRLTPDNVDINDDKVWNAIRDDTTQIFQWEGNTGDTYIKKLLSDENIKKFQEVNENVDKMTLLSIGNSAIRPAGASYREDLANGVVRKSGSDAIDEFLKPTFGYLVFQCQIIEFLHSYCGFTMGEADIVRRHFAKKTGTDKDIPVIKDGGYMNDKKDHYIPGFIATMKEKYGMKKEDAENAIIAFLQVIIDASAYLFSINHSCPYSYEGYVSGYLRTYYPLEFLTVALNINKDKEEKTRALTVYAKKVGIEIRIPKFRHSKSGYFCDKESNCIYKGICSVKFMNDQISDELYSLRNNTYLNFVDLLYDIEEKTTLNSRQLDILIKIDFFEEFGDINKLLYIRDKFDEIHDKKQIRKDKLEEFGIPDDIVRKYSSSETDTVVKEIDIEAYLKDQDIQDIEEELSDCIKYKYEPILTPKQKRQINLLQSIEANQSFEDDEDSIIQSEINSIIKSAEKSKIPNGYSFSKIFKKYKLDEDMLIKYATKKSVGRFDEIDAKKILYDLSEWHQTEPCSVSQRIKYQVEHLGYVEYVDPDADKHLIAILDLDTTYTPKFEAYSLMTGQTCTMKIRNKIPRNSKKVKTCFKDVPLENGDIIYMNKCSKEAKKKKGPDGEWITVPGEFWWYVDDYRKVNL